jgi:hypothetical protein
MANLEKMQMNPEQTGLSGEQNQGIEKEKQETFAQLEEAQKKVMEMENEIRALESGFAQVADDLDLHIYFKDYFLPIYQIKCKMRLYREVLENPKDQLDILLPAINLQQSSIKFLREVMSRTPPPAAEFAGDILVVKKIEEGNIIQNINANLREEINQMIVRLNNFKTTGNLMQDTMEFVKLIGHTDYDKDFTNGTIDPTQFLLEVKLFNERVIEAGLKQYAEKEGDPDSLKYLNTVRFPEAILTAIDAIFKDKA